VRGCEYETEGQVVVQYTVVSSLLRSRQYLVNHHQVRSISLTEMMVDDAVSRQSKYASRRRLTIKPDTAPVNPRKIYGSGQSSTSNQ
jgi:hypothetical protein